jgi:hypothetical protein
MAVKKKAKKSGRKRLKAPRFTVEAGRSICHDGKPFISIVREGDTRPTNADKVTHLIAKSLNKSRFRKEDR